jgi:hypothetical protein
MMDVAYITDEHLLYYDATNERSLSAGRLNFPENADCKAFCDKNANLPKPPANCICQ